MSETTASDDFNKPLTIEMVEEAKALMKVLAPKEAPKDVFLIRGQSGIRIMKNEIMPDDTIVLSKRLFDLIFEASNKEG